MLPRKSKILLIIAAVLFISGAAWFYFGVYHIREFSGDGTISDNGFNSSRSQGRYHIRFPPMSLTEAGKRTFTFQGLPLVPLTLGLRVVEPPIVRQSEYEVLTKLNTVVQATLKDSAGEVFVDVSDPLKQWRLAWSGNERSDLFWHQNAPHLRAKRGQGYQLTLVVRDIDPKSPPLVVEPTLYGGGIDLP